MPSGILVLDDLDNILLVHKVVCRTVSVSTAEVEVLVVSICSRLCVPRVVDDDELNRIIHATLVVVVLNPHLFYFHFESPFAEKNLVTTFAPE